MRKNKKFLILVICLLLITLSFANVNNYKTVTAESATSAKSMVLIDKDSNRVLLSKNKDTKLAMASTTKIFTVYYALQKIKDMDAIVKISDEAVGVGGTSMYLKHDEEVPLMDLLYGVIVPSGNDACVALACYVSGSQDKFVEEMNEFYTKLGLKNTHLDNAHGLDSKTHYTSSYDLAQVTSLALDNDIFKDLVSKKSIVINPTNKYGKRYLTNKNRLLSQMKNCIGVKIGFTDDAGRCLVSAVKTDEGQTFICVVLNCYDMFNESKYLLNHAVNNYSNIEVVKPYSIIAEAQIKDSQKVLKVYNKEGFYYPISEQERNMLDLKINLIDNITTPIKKDQEVGEMQVLFNEELVFSAKLYSMEKVDGENNIGAIKKIINNWS